MNKEDFEKKLDKLPVFAKQYIEKLRRDVSYLQKTLDAMKTGNTSIWWTEYGAMGWTDADVIHLPDRAIVTFKLGNGKEIDVAVRNGILKVSTSSWITIIPDASNTVSITSANKQDFEKED